MKHIIQHPHHCLSRLSLLSVVSVCLLSTIPAQASGNSPVPDKWLSRDLPSEWVTDTLSVVTSPASDKWWQSMGDPVLDQLIEMAEANNLDIHQSLINIQQANLSLKRTRSAYFPTVGLDASWTKGRNSGMTGPQNGRASGYDYFDLGLSASWEIDLFGRIKSRADANKADIDLSKADRASMVLSICASVAKNYFTLRCYQQQLEVALDHINSQEHVQEITEARYQAGLASSLDVAQARTIVLSTKATVPRLKALIESQINTIATLCGVYPDALPAEVALHGVLPDPALSAPVGVPADLLRRRPDIVASEYSLRRLAANIGVAKKDFLPTLSITGQIGTSARNLGDLFKNESFTYSVTPQLSWTIFEGMARKYAVDAAKLDLQSAVDGYNQTVMQAVGEVNDNLSLYQSALEEMDLEKEVIAQSEKTLELAMDRYKLGLSDFTNVANAQLTLLENRNALLSAKSNALNDLVSLYQSLGGGWDVERISETQISGK